MGQSGGGRGEGSTYVKAHDSFVVCPDYITAGVSEIMEKYKLDLNHFFNIVIAHP